MQQKNKNYYFQDHRGSTDHREQSMAIKQSTATLREVIIAQTPKILFSMSFDVVLVARRFNCELTPFSITNICVLQAHIFAV